MIARRSVACGHRSLHPAQPNSTAQETRAFLRALELRESAALGERRAPDGGICFQTLLSAARGLGPHAAITKYRFINKDLLKQIYRNNLIIFLKYYNIVITKVLIEYKAKWKIDKF